MTNRRLKQTTRLSMCGDLTLDHFANSKASSSRLKKGQLTVVEDYNNNDVDWFDKDDYEGISEFNEDEITSSLKTLQVKADTVDIDGKGNVYPIDLWFILSDYIKPELVGKFSLICRDSYFVTCTKLFYKRLWQYYEPKMKSALQRTVCNNVCHSFTRNRAYRANVIRALHYCYPLFEKSKTASFSQSLHDVEGACCMMQWHKFYNKKCTFNFKMKFPSTVSCPLLNSMKNKDGWSNPEDGCCVLQIICRNFLDLSRSQIGGLTLTKSYVTVSSDMTSQKIKLVFHDTKRRLKPISLSRYKEATGVVIVLTSVTSYQVLHWWHPAYPFNNAKDR